MKRLAIGFAFLFVISAVAAGVAATQLPAIGAGALLFPTRHLNRFTKPDACEERAFQGVAVTLRGWQCRSTAANHKGTIIYLHGVADSRGSSLGAIATFLPLGYDVVAYDSRAHGESGGDRCTYGYFEKRDVQRVIEQLDTDPIILIGHSLGAAVALQTAAIEPRIKGVVAASTFSDLRTIATERAHAMMLPAWSLGPAFERAEHDGQFVVDEVSPVRAASRITAPVLLVHGADDRDTPPIHSQRVFAALREPRQLIIVPAAGHNDVLRPRVWEQIANWMSSSLPK